MEDFVYFFSFQDPNVVFVVLGISFLSISAAMVGTFTFLDKKALIGDAISHAVLPGVCLAFTFTGTKNPYWIVVGAFATGALATYAISWVTEHTKLKEDTVIAAVLSVFFGVGIVFMTKLQQTGNAAISGLDHFLFGNAISIVGEDILVYGSLALLTIFTLLIFYKEFKLLIFNRDFAVSVGFPVKSLQFIFNSLMVLAVVTGIQAIGVVLMAGLLITPVAAARFWTDRLGAMLFIAVIFALVSGVAGAYISFVFPNMPTGPWVVVVLSLVAFASFSFSHKKGLITRWYAKRKYQEQIHSDHILKSLYNVLENGGKGISLMELKKDFPGKDAETERSIKRLINKAYLSSNKDFIELADAGLSEARRIIRLHRLWELYLTEYMNIAPDHVHDTAEKMEHILTPEIEAKLEAYLDFPSTDPHQSIIPRDES